MTDTTVATVTQYRCEHPKHKVATDADCCTCADYLLPTANSGAQINAMRQRGRSPHPDGIITDRYGRPARLADLFVGSAVFLVLGGPSTKTLSLHLLSRRGIAIMSVNNCPAVLPDGIRPLLWIHTDKCQKFHWDLWRDPSVIKIVPRKEWNLGPAHKALRRRDKQGNLERVEGAHAKQMTSVFGFERSSNFDPANWMFEPSINRGNDKEHATGKNKHDKVIGKPNGWPHIINTMFAALRIAFLLGFARVYLIGADFKMSEDQPYGFDQTKHRGGCNSNNTDYAKMAAMFDALKPRFDDAGFTVQNCTPESGLWTFPYLSLEEAVEREAGDFEQTLDTKGYYDVD